MNKTESAEVDLPFKMRALGNFIRKLVCTGEPGDPAEIQAQACDEAADEIENLQAEKDTLSRELSVYMEAVTKLENAIDGL